MTVAYFDCFSGVSGDMILGALVDAGWDGLQLALTQLQVPGWTLRTERVSKQGLSATKVDFEIETHASERNLQDMRAIVAGSGLSHEIREHAAAILEGLARAEAAVHGCRVEEVHFHELGGLDTLLDIVGACAGIVHFGFKQIQLSAVAVGSGTVETRHGVLPVPAPATAKLLEGWMMVDGGVARELTTPTGAAILTHFAAGQGLPPMKLERVAYGAGLRDLDRPNVLRLMLGEPVALSADDQVVVLETTIDDMNPELLPVAVDRLLAAGARDVFSVPVQGKKARQATLLTVLAAPGDEERLIEMIFRETTTIGLRMHSESRRVLPRHEEMVSTEFGAIRVKVAGEGALRRAKPEFDDCVRLAEQHGVPVNTVLQAALRQLDDGAGPRR